MAGAPQPDPEFHRAVNEYQTCLRKAGEALDSQRPDHFRYYLSGAWNSLRNIEREMFHTGQIAEYSAFWRQATAFLGHAYKAAEADELGAAKTSLAAASRLADHLLLTAQSRQDPAPQVLAVLATNPPGGTLRMADIIRSLDGAAPQDAAEAVRRLVRAGMVRALPGMHRALSARGRQIWATGYEITDLGRQALAGRLPIPQPANRERGGAVR